MRGELLLSALGDEAPTGEHEDAVAGLGDLGEDVGGDEHGAVALEADDQIAHLADLARIQARDRLIEDDELGLVDDRLGDADPFAVPQGQLGDHAVGDIGDVALLEHTRQAREDFSLGHPLELPDILDEVGHPHVAVKRRLFWQKPDARADAVGRLKQVNPADAHAARAGQQKPREDLERGRFSSAVEA